MGIGGAAGGAIFGIGDVMVRNLVNHFVTDVKSVLQNDLKHIFDDLPPGAFGEGSSLGDGFSGDLAGLVADHAPNLTSMGDHPPPALKPEKVDALANGYGDLFAKYFADLVDSDGNRLGSDTAKTIGSDFGKKIGLNLADLKRANISPLLTDAFTNHAAYFNEPLRDALTRRYPIAITRSLDEARHSLRRYATQGLGNAASDFVNGVFSSFVQTAIFDPENMSFDWKTGLLNIGAGYRPLSAPDGRPVHKAARVDTDPSRDRHGPAQRRLRRRPAGTGRRGAHGHPPAERTDDARGEFAGHRRVVADARGRAGRGRGVRGDASGRAHRRGTAGSRPEGQGSGTLRHRRSESAHRGGDGRPLRRCPGE